MLTLERSPGNETCHTTNYIQRQPPSYWAVKLGPFSPQRVYGRFEITARELFHFSGEWRASDSHLGQGVGVLSGQSPHSLDHKLRVDWGLDGPEVYELLLLLLLLVLMLMLLLLLILLLFDIDFVDVYVVVVDVNVVL